MVVMVTVTLGSVSMVGAVERLLEGLGGRFVLASNELGLSLLHGIDLAGNGVGGLGEIRRGLRLRVGVELAEGGASTGHLGLDELLGVLEFGELGAERAGHAVDFRKILHLLLELGLKDALLLLLLEVFLLFLERSNFGLLLSETTRALFGLFDSTLQLLQIVVNLLDLSIELSGIRISIA